MILLYLTTFNAFDKTLLDEITKVQNVFNQMEVVVHQCSSCGDECNKCLELETGLFKKKDMIEKDVYDKLVKAQSQEKDTVIRKMKDRIKYLSGKESVEKVNKDINDIETINIELEHKHNDSLIAQINAKSVENLDLNVQLPEKVFAIAPLKYESRKLNGKNVVDTVVSTPIATTIAPGMFKLDIKPISHRLKNNRDAHKDYLNKTIENTDTIHGLVERVSKQNPSKPLLDSACMYIKHVQELLVYVSKTCPSLTKPSEKLVDVTPLNKDKKVRFADLLTSSSNTQKPVNSNITIYSNKPLLNSTGVKCSTGARGSKPSGNTKNNRNSQSLSSNKTNKVEDQSRSVKSRKNKKNLADKTECNAHVMQSMLNVNYVSKPISNALVKC
ncbi:hypothetical protein Tco_0024821 [Tanacetum coccineum]